MAKQVITVSASKTPQTVTIETNDPVITIAGGTPLDPVIPPPVVDPPPVVTPGYTQTYANGFDKASDLDPNQLGKGSISNTVVDNSAGSFKSLVQYGDQPISSGFRSEQQYNGAAQNPKEGKFTMDVYFESWDHFGWGACFPFQMHPGGNDNGGSALFFMEACQQKWNMYCFAKGYQDSYQSCDPITPKKWYSFEAQYLWSLNKDGYFRIYIDGKLYWSYTGPTQMSNDQPYLKIGSNHFGANARTSPHGMVAYIDNFVVYKKN